MFIVESIGRKFLVRTQHEHLAHLEFLLISPSRDCVHIAENSKCEFAVITKWRFLR